MHRTFLGHEKSAKEEVTDSVVWEWKDLLRGLLWRLKLGVLPSSSPCIKELRRAAADGRRKYAELRRRLLVDPHAMEGSRKSHPFSVDNPLSQDPDSVWSRYFQISELEETIDNDLMRLYPEHSDFFQSPACKAMLRRILSVWSLIHPNCSYRQGMHELLAPLLYVLHCDVAHLSEVKQRYENLFNDRFEEPFCLQLRTHENGEKQRNKGLPCSKTVTTSENLRSHINVGSVETTAGQKCAGVQADEWNYGLRILVLGTDTYGAEGELGVLLSARYVEHDAFLMFNALMCGKGGGLNMADYFLASKGQASSGLSPALEASSLLYKALATADLPLYSHLTGLGVEPQFFALRWIRVLFGREFDLQTLLVIWDAVFSMAETYDIVTPGEENLIGPSSTPRKDFILALAVSMLLYLRMTLLAAPNSTSCLQKLLNFPRTVGVEVLIESARNLSPFVTEHTCNSVRVEKSANVIETETARKSTRKSLFEAETPRYSPEFLQQSFPDFYWEEKWKNSVLKNDTQTDQCEESLPIACSATKDQNGSANVQQNMILVADKSKRNSRLEFIDGSNAATATPMPVSNFSKTGASYESIEGNVPTHGSHQTLGCREGKARHSECTRTDNGPEREPSTKHVAESDAVPSSTSPLKALLYPRKYWLWSFGKSRGQEKGTDKKITVHPETSREQIKVAAAVKSGDKMALVGEKKPVSRNKESNSINNHANELCSVSSSIMPGERDQLMTDLLCEPGKTDSSSSISGIVHAGEEARHLIDLGTLGQCMAEKIEAIETALAQILTSGMKDGLSVNSDVCEGMLMSPREAGSSKAAPKTVHAAIEDLKKISNKLIQM